ncbi:MAG TPA: malto-oligosyltrehalose trehalohydrolase [Firmicutes bacterium]|nr:malto-oligosyltrehalose trehalohydrolase [Bacillota bacterium]
MELQGAKIIDRSRGLVEFTVTAYNRKQITVNLKSGNNMLYIPMHREKPHLFKAQFTGAGLNLLYKFCLDQEGCFPDPYSNFQPQGVHGYSAVIDHEAYNWQDQGWPGLDLETAIIYELHVGTFTPQGTFMAAASRLGYLKGLGITAVELMPVVQTPGRWNWGYDGANLFSVNHIYGTPDDLKYLVDCCHRYGLAVILDVVYNHLGPEGNYLSQYGPYFTEKYNTPWGAAVNFDDRGSEIMRQMVLSNVTYWLELYHLDGLRLDAVHAITDHSPRHILQEIAGTVDRLSERLNRKLAVIAESDENQVKLINPPHKGGYGLHAQWMDDFHHCIHTVLTGEGNGYYIDYGDINHLKKVYRNYLYTGAYSRFWKKHRGSDASSNPGRQFVVSIQTHDQVGNRAAGERLSRLVDFPYLKAAAGMLLLAPYVPMLFMGEEYGEQRPFLFFTDFGSPELKQAVYKGRREEFKDFGWDEIPNPEEDSTFYRSRLTSPARWSDRQKKLLAFYRELIALRKNRPALKFPDKKGLHLEVYAQPKVVKISRRSGEETLSGWINFGPSPFTLSRPAPPERDRIILDSEWERFGGKGTAVDNEGILAPGQFILIENS